jgi:hypothetical protein
MLGAQHGGDNDHTKDHAMAAGEIVSAPAPGNILRDAVLALAPLGKSAMRRAAIEGSRCPDGSSGSAAINEANLSLAVTLGNRANFAASCQGSISNRASAERTPSSIPFLSSQIGANRKSSNSDPSREIEAERVIGRRIPSLLSNAQTDNKTHGAALAPAPAVVRRPTSKTISRGGALRQARKLPSGWNPTLDVRARRRR